MHVALYAYAELVAAEQVRASVVHVRGLLRGADLDPFDEWTVGKLLDCEIATTAARPSALASLRELLTAAKGAAA